MRTNRREFLAATTAGIAAASLGAPADGRPQAPIRRIATEEAFATPELVKAWLAIARAEPGSSLDVPTGILSIFDNPRPGSNQDRFRRQLLDLDAERLADMEAAGVDMQILSVTIPGVQMFEPDMASALAITTNDHLAAAIARHPRRFAGLACFAPQDPVRAVREMERAVKMLGLNGFIVNSHTGNLYLDDARFAPILEAAQALDRPIYLHPRAPSNGMAGPFRDYSMGGSIWGFGVEAGTHAVRLILSGVFDRYPRLRIVLGHMGEALPFWMWRLDHMAVRRAKDGRMKPLALAPSAYFRRNIAVTTSGFEAPEVLELVIKTAGIENVMWAIDYPYENSRDAVAFIDGARLTPAQRSSILHRNAERLFHIE
ncbi:putative TIM-barrel fold metal-dependent hydrolase [Sphingomonas naasensis]|uniref:Amidohydrolase n=1 Tax=Sphingomonas naasensis TaxID=1344951 RepID=A0A4S1W7X5_9SPHN|nr:amidohydrolase family protein [Sphingomonas naasensis]NIJ21370.1 putative TIM-barrel fold metal-dependent hydrolase [Sphingomonas naasensis]TGX38829.1 amidohydrolase [Sphingomonas naasensis]